MRACKAYAASMRYHHVSLGELSTVAGAGERRVRAAFYDCEGMSPTAALRTAALEAVRQRLLEHPAFSDAVTRAASDFGFWHLSRFAGQYRALFGESPHETLTRPTPAAR